MPVLHGVVWQSDLLRPGASDEVDDHRSQLSGARTLAGRTASLQTSRSTGTGSIIDSTEHESTNLSLFAIEEDEADAAKRIGSPFASSGSTISASARHALQKLVDRRKNRSPILLRLSQGAMGDMNMMTLDSAIEAREEDKLKQRAFDRDELQKLSQLAQIGRALSSRPSTAMSKKSCSVSDFPVENESGAGLGLVGWKIRRMRMQAAAQARSRSKQTKRISFQDDAGKFSRGAIDGDVQNEAQRVSQLQNRSSFKNATTEQLDRALERKKKNQKLSSDAMLSTYKVCNGERVAGVKNLHIRTPGDNTAAAPSLPTAAAAAAAASNSNLPAFAWRAQPKLRITKHLANELVKEVRNAEKRMNGESIDGDTVLFRSPNERSLRKANNMPNFYYKNLHLFDWFNDQYDLGLARE